MPFKFKFGCPDNFFNKAVKYAGDKIPELGGIHICRIELDSRKFRIMSCVYPLVSKILPDLINFVESRHQKTL